MVYRSGRWHPSAAATRLPDIACRSTRGLCREVRLLIRDSETTVVWVVKPFRTSLAVASAALDADGIVVTDVDDDDAGLARDFRASSIRNRARLHPLRQLHPRRIAGAARQLAKASDGWTFASTSVAARVEELYGPWPGQSLRIPHPRDVPESIPPRRTDGVPRIGFFGTIRAHKGLEHIVRLIETFPELELQDFSPARSTRDLAERSEWSNTMPKSRCRRHTAQLTWPCCHRSWDVRAPTFSFLQSSSTPWRTACRSSPRAAILYMKWQASRPYTSMTGRTPLRCAERLPTHSGKSDDSGPRRMKRRSGTRR